MSRLSAEDRFWAKVDKTDTCWLWTGGTNTTGYGVLRVNYVFWVAHRYSWHLAGRAVGEGYVLDHTCHTPACVRPSHLRLATNKQNGENRRGAAAHSKSGVRGVYWDAKKARWVASVGHFGKIYHAGQFKDLADAEVAVIAMRNKLFTHNIEVADVA